MDFETFKNASVRFELKTGSIVLGIMLSGINLNLPVQLVGTACASSPYPALITEQPPATGDSILSFPSTLALLHVD